MATKEVKPEGEAAPKKSKKLLIIIVALVLVLVAGGAAAFFMLHKADAEAEGDDEAAVETHKPAKKKKGEKEAPAVFVPLEVFTVNLVPEQGDQYLQLSISVEVDDIETGDSLKASMPKLRNKVMLLLSDKKASELLPKEGKEKLAGELRAQMNSVLAPGMKPENGPVKEVLFTSFIIQ
ncbi:flagellar basal body-associated protein FliL [Rhodocyclus tenuis]|uniref:Flagellar protein FliL n=1 Tax=Rhodocyclus tenuis TaxID=1066 RepID=A0A840FXY7_RHOTE|nr:flagellar basal body-associated protein FliL [Rhodocyclus tenuis]MBB4246684.1 flagellar FliL protein [Rhodocyclus tenuis]MBK1679979.1 flagellar basal body protein FliL [Rhodocyclus tenuis]